MRIYEINTIKPLTPQQSRINSLKQQKELASNKLKAEKDKQKKAKELDNIRKSQIALSKL